MDSTTALQTGPPPLGLPQLFYAAVVVGIPIAIAGSFSLGLSKDASIAALRACVQLTVLATFILGPLLRTTRPELVLLYVGFMCAVAGREGSSKLSWRYAGALQHCVVAAAIGSGAAVFIGIAFIIQPKPWFSATTLIPVAVGLRTYLEELGDHPDRAQLSLGFAGGVLFTILNFCGCVTLCLQAFKTALTPAINSMSVSGLVSIPGMMTGQVLAGQDPVEASRYQIMITYLIAGGAFTSVGVAVVLASRTLFDSHGCFRSDMLVPPQSSRKSSTATTSSKTSDAGFSVASDKHFSDGTLSQVTLHQQKTNKVSKSDGGRVPHENAAVVLAGRNLQGRVRGRLLFELATFSVVEGEICVVRGVSGRGKTRLLALLNATCPFNEHDCRDATTGTLSNVITFREDSIQTMGGPSWRRHVLLVPQHIPALADHSAESWFRMILGFDANAALTQTTGKIEETVRRMHDVGQQLGLHEDQLRNAKLNTLSGGERHRAILTCAFALQPPVLLLDEPTAALDADTRNTVAQVIVALTAKHGTAVVMVTHDLELSAQLAHSQIVFGGDAADVV